MSASSTVADQSLKATNDDDDADVRAYRPQISCEQQDLLNRMYGMCEDAKPTKNYAWRPSGDPASRLHITPPSKPSYPPEELDTDFKRSYPPDQFGDEVEPHARVWNVYRDEATAHDEPMVELWNKTLDILLIFAGLFSAVETAFIVEAYKTLLPDYDAYTARMIYASFGNGTFSVDSLSGLGDPSVVAVSSSSRWINGLWFLSLLLALAVALLCILTKQWVQYYIHRINSLSSSPQHWARRRSLYYEGLLRWHLPGLISTLPVLLHVSLFVFLAGLVLFVWDLDRFIGLGLLSLTSTLLGFYIFCFVAPMWSIDSPSMSPLLEQLMSIRVHLDLLRWSATMIHTALHRARRGNRLPPIDDEENGDKELSPSVAGVSLAVRRSITALSVARGRVWFVVQDLWNMHFAYFFYLYIYQPIWDHVWTRAEKSAEQRALDQRASELDAATISWLVRSASNHDAVRVALQATGSLHPASRGSALLRGDPIVNSKAGAMIGTTVGTQDGLRTSKSPADIARLIRVALSQDPLLDQYGLGVRWNTISVCDYDLFLMSRIFTSHTPVYLQTNQLIPSLDAPRGLCDADKSPVLHSTVLLLLGLRSTPLLTKLELVDLLDLSLITDEDAGHVTASLMHHAVRNGHTHRSPCKRDCLVDILSDIALTSAPSASRSSSPRIHSTSLGLIRRLLRLQIKAFRARINWPAIYRSTASTQCCIGLVVPNFLDLLASGLYNGSTELEWYAAALFLSSALDYYGSTRISPMRCEQLLGIVSTALRSVPPREIIGDFFPPRWPRGPLLEICSVVYALYHPRSQCMYRADRLGSLYRTQLQVAHDTCSLSDGLLPLLNRSGDTPSVWSVVVSSLEMRHTTALSIVLAIQLCSGARRGLSLLGISSLIDEFFAYNWGLDALRGKASGVSSDSEAAILHLMIQHCVELKPDWWENVRARVDAGDEASVSGGGKVLHVDPLGPASRRRDLRNYDRWLAKRRPGPCVMCAGCKRLEPENV